MYANMSELVHEGIDMPDVRTHIHGDIRSTDTAPPPEGFTAPNPPNGGELVSERINTGSGTGPDNLGPFRAATQDELAQGKGFWYNVVGGGYYGLPPDNSQGRQTMPVAKSGANDGTPSGSAAPAAPLDPLNNALAGMLGGGGGADITPPTNAASPVATSSGGGSGAAIFIIVLLVAGIAGYYYYKHHKKGKGVEHDG